MGLLRNPEVKEFFRFQFFFTLAAAAGAALFHPVFAVYVFFVSMVCAARYLAFTKKRYDTVSELNYQLDRILHGDYRMDLIPDEEGELALLTSEIYKVTLRLKEQADALEQETRYLSDSLADISHQIRTPLTSMRMIVPRLQREELTSEERRKYVGEVIGLLSRTEWLIASLLKMARLESGTAVVQCERIFAAEVVEQALSPVDILIDLKEITCEVSIKKNTGFTGDLHWSAEAVGNVIKNCVEHMPERGKLEIYGDENPVYTELLIADSGPGIASEDIPHLFERFYRGKDSGTDHVGIGLALSRMIVHRQNDTIQVENRREGGAKFTIRFYKGAV